MDRIPLFPNHCRTTGADNELVIGALRGVPREAVRKGKIMKRVTRLMYGSLVLALAACGTKNKGAIIQNVPGQPGQMTAQEAGEATYRFAFSGQVLNGVTGDAVKQFAVSLLGSDPAVSTVVNALGDQNGVFHISRNPSLKDTAFNTLSLLISAPGFQPVVQKVDLGADCQGANCAGTKPTSFLLQALPAIVQTVTQAAGVPSAGASPATGAAALSSIVGTLLPATVSSTLQGQGAGAIFNSLVQNGKLDPALQQLLAGAKNKDVLSNVLVLLNGNTGGQNPANLITGLLSGVSGGKLNGLNGNVAQLASQLIPLLAATNPQVGGAILAVNTLLPYLTPVLQNLGGGNAGPLGNVLQTLLKGNDPQGNLASLASLLQGTTGPGASQGVQLAMGSLLPLVQGFLNKGQGGTSNPFEAILTQALQNPNLLGGLAGLTKPAGGSTQGLSMLAGYLQPLIQGLVGKNASQLAPLFNQLVKQGGIQGLQGFVTGAGATDQFAALIPYLEPLVKGLNSQDASALATALAPLLAQNNPAAAIRGLLTKGGNGGLGGILQMASSLFPAIRPVLNQAVPAKQVLTAQLLQGLVNGDFKNLQVTQDLKGNAAVVLSGQVRDLLKLAQLPNVTKLVSVAGGQ